MNNMQLALACGDTTVAQVVEQTGAQVDLKVRERAVGLPDAC